MSDLNVLGLVGRVSQDGIIATSASGLPYCHFSIAVNRSHKKEDGTWEEAGHFFPLALFGPRAEALAKYLVKGQIVSINGHLAQDRYEVNGKTTSRTVIEIDDLRLVGAKKEKDEAANVADGPETDPDLDLSLDSGEENQA
jgi:single-strand DNA-binding protein